MLPRTLKNFNLFIADRGYAGRVEELTPPKLTLKTEEFRGGGMDTPVEIDLGTDKLELSATVAEYDPELLALLGKNKTKFELRGAMQNDKNETTAVLVACTGFVKELDPGSWKAGDKGTIKFTAALSYYRLELAGQNLIEIDVENMVRKLRGVDQLASQRAALGI